MPALQASSEFRIEKQRVDAVLTLARGTRVNGHFFLAQASPVLDGRERVGELLNLASGLIPFAETEGHTVLYNRDHIVMVQMSEEEARWDPGYSVATARTVSMVLSTGALLRGTVRVYRPEGRDRLSDWARERGRFRYVETTDATFLVNVDHIVHLREVV